MSDEDKIAEYNRIQGVKKAYVHETAFEDGIRRKARRAKYGYVKTRPVKRQGDTPSGKSSVVSISQAQYHAYQLIIGFFKSSGKDEVAVEILRSVGVRKATIKALEKQELVWVTDKKQLKIWKRHFTCQEQMENYRATS